VWESTVDGRVLHFHLAGINNQNFIMRDEETGSWWQQVSGKAIHGPLQGRQLKSVFHDEVSFEVWKREQPQGRVLKPDERIAASNQYDPADWEARVGRMRVVPADILRRRKAPMNYFDAIILGIVEGLTEFLPISSTGHLTIAEKMLGLEVDDPAVTGFTAVIQMGAIAAVILYFARDIWNIVRTWLLGLVKPEYRGHRDFRMGWYVIVGTIPVGVVGLAFRDVIKNDLRSLWVVAVALLGWSAVMWAAERSARQDRSEKGLNLTDALVVGLFQCVSLIPGVSRSGATISAGLFRGLDRVTATRLSFFLSIPALLAAGIFEMKDALGGDIGVGETVVGTVVSFVVAYASIAWLLRFVAHHPITWFVPYRGVLGVLLLVLLATGGMSAT